jgi:hypothetical protein
MSPEELAEKYIDFRRRFLSWSSIAQRLPAQWNVLPWAYLGMNLALRQATGRQEQRFQEYFTWLHNGRATPTFDAPT